MPPEALQAAQRRRLLTALGLGLFGGILLLAVSLLKRKPKSK
jgi:hypothetical protein